MSRILVTLCGLALFGIGYFAVGEVMAGAPAFNADVRRAGVFGDWRVNPGTSLYDRSEYYLQLGYGHLNADGLVNGAAESDGTGDDAIGGPDAIEKAVEFLEESVTLAPGNAHAWAWLAWAYASRGDGAKALDALEASWRLAPYHVHLAITRLTCFEVIKTSSENTGIGSDNEITRTGVRRDLDALARYNRRAFRDAMAQSDVLRLYRPAD